jgi:putative oxidoreductase
MMSKSVSFGLLLLRLALGIIFIAHGSQKVLGWFGGPGLAGTVSFMGQMGVPPFMAYLAAFAEFLGGLGVFVGLLTRLASFGILADMVVAVYLVHWKNGFFMQNKGFEYNLALIGMALCLIFTGAGRLSLDALFCRRGSPPS